MKFRAMVVGVLVVVGVSSLLGCSNANRSGQGFRDEDNAARHLLEITGAAELGIQVMNQMIVSFREMFPAVPSEFWDEFMREVTTDELLDLMVPIYVDNFTLTELRQIIEFYETPIGQKMIEKTPAIMQQSMRVGEKWGEEIGRRVQRRLMEGGYI